MFGRSEFQRRIGRAVDAALVPDEQRRAAAFLRGPGPVGEPGTVPGPDRDWVVVATDRRVLLFPVAAATRSPTVSSAAAQTYPLDGVQVVDATLRGVAPVLVLRFPDAVLAWFHPLPAWRSETEKLVAELRGDRSDAGDAYPDETRQDPEPQVP